jgi:hypothetical protein
VEAADHLERVLERAEAIAAHEVAFDREPLRRAAGEEARDERVLERGGYDGDGGAIRQQLRKVEGIGCEERVLEVDHAEPALLHVEVPAM